MVALKSVTLPFLKRIETHLAHERSEKHFISVYSFVFEVRTLSHFWKTGKKTRRVSFSHTDSVSNLFV